MTTPSTIRYSVRLLRAGSFKLDGGSMFGLIPRSVWSKTAATDDKGRITVAHNCLLLEAVGDMATGGTTGGATGGAVQDKGWPGVPRRVLVETGSGDKLDPKMREVFELELNPAGHAHAGRARAVHDALAEIDIDPESIDAVLVTHLHFDHAGGLTRLARAGEVPTWAVPPHDDGGGGSAQTHGCVQTFPNAQVVVQEREWEDAIRNRSVMTKTYYPDHLHPIADKLLLLDSPRPFVSGYTPDRFELPSTPVEFRETFPWPGRRGHGQDAGVPEAGISVFCVPGHTWGQQAIKVLEALPPHGKGRTIVFTPDVMPTAAHLGAAYSLAYDVEPYTSMISRRWLLTEAAAQGWVLCLDHEPGHPLFRVRASSKGWFDLVPEPI